MDDPGDRECVVSMLEPSWCEIPAGSFLMGAEAADPEASADERPQHVIWLPTYSMARYPVTNAEWQLWVDAGGATPRHIADSRFNRANQPVVGVTWYDAMAYARWLSDRVGYRVSIPTEAQWEKASRGSDGRRYPFGNRLTRVHPSSGRRRRRRWSLASGNQTVTREPVWDRGSGWQHIRMDALEMGADSRRAEVYIPVRGRRPRRRRIRGSPYRSWRSMVFPAS